MRIKVLHGTFRNDLEKVPLGHGAQSLIKFIEQILLELNEIVLINASTLAIKANQGRLGEDVLKVLELFFKQSVLGRESGVLFTELLLDFLKLLNPFLKVVLVSLLSHSASHSTLTVLHPPLKLELRNG